MSLINLINTPGGFYIICIIIFAILLLIKGMKKRKLPSETYSVRLFIDIISLLSLVPLIYFIGSDGTKYIFGNDVTDLFLPLSVASINFIVSILNRLKKFFK